MVISLVDSNRFKEVRIACSLIFNAVLNVFRPVMTSPLLIVIPLQLASFELASSSRCKNSLNVLASLYQSQPIIFRCNLIQPSILCIKKQPTLRVAPTQ